MSSTRERRLWVFGHYNVTTQYICRYTKLDCLYQNSKLILASVFQGRWQGFVLFVSCLPSCMLVSFFFLFNLPRSISLVKARLLFDIFFCKRSTYYVKYIFFVGLDLRSLNSISVSRRDHLTSPSSACALIGLAYWNRRHAFLWIETLALRETRR